MKKILLLSLVLIIQINSVFANFELQQASAFMQKKEYSKALFYYEQAINNSPNAQEIYIEYIACLRLSSMLNEAVKQSYIALEINESNPDIWLSLANVFIELHEWDKSYQSIMKADEYKADSSSINTTLLNLSYKMIVASEYQKTYKYIDAVLSKNNNNALANIYKGLLEYISDKKVPAEDLVNKGIKLAEQDSNLRIADWGYRILNAFKSDIKELLNSIQFEQYQVLADELKSIPEKGKAKQLQVPKITERFYNIFNQSELVISAPSDLVSKTVLNNESGSIDIRFIPVMGKDKFDVWISQYPGDISPEDFKNKSESILNPLIKKSPEPDTKIQQYSDENVKISYVTVKDLNYNPIADDSYQFITQGMAKYKNGFVVFSIMTLEKESIDAKMEIVKTLQINKK